MLQLLRLPADMRQLDVGIVGDVGLEPPFAEAGDKPTYRPCGFMADRAYPGKRRK